MYTLVPWLSGEGQQLIFSEDAALGALKASVVLSESIHRGQKWPVDNGVFLLQKAVDEDGGML